jgi:hypothetical protein
MMRTPREDLLLSCEELRSLCARPVEAGSSTFDHICFVLRRLSDLSASSEIAMCALEVRFKAEDLFNRAHLTSEAVLRVLLDDRVQHLDALMRMSTGAPRDRRSPGRHGRRATDHPGSDAG